jgi:NADH dehydrogenase
MFVIFGASTDIGQRLGAKLRAENLPVRSISRSAPGSIAADLNTGDGLKTALDGAEVVISCAHARHTDRLIAALPASVRRLVLMGSAWRYSHIPNLRADEVRAGEARFIASQANGVMLHSAMIYGGHQENNIQRLLRLIRKTPVIPAPGGGKHTVQPIYIDDVVNCLFSAAQRDWHGANVLPIAGPKLKWREMVLQCAAAIDRRRLVLPIPSTPLIAALRSLHRLRLSPVHPDVIRRFSEDVDIPLGAMTEQLSVLPRDFTSGIALAVSDWRRAGII